MRFEPQSKYYFQFPTKKPHMSNTNLNTILPFTISSFQRCSRHDVKIYEVRFTLIRFCRPPPLKSIPFYFVNFWTQQRLCGRVSSHVFDRALENLTNTKKFCLIDKCVIFACHSVVKQKKRDTINHFQRNHLQTSKKGSLMSNTVIFNNYNNNVKYQT